MRTALFAVAAAMTTNISIASASCPGRFAVEVLGSGGPIAEDDRASAGYLVWVDGEARLLIDAGGGTFLRFAESRASLMSINAILISHFHADHVADLAALLKSGSFDERTAPLTIAGPSGNAYFPGLGEFLSANFDSAHGAYRYLSGYLAGENGLSPLVQIEIDASARQTRTVVEAEQLRADALPVNHGDVPALAFTVTVDGETAVFAGDQSLFSDYFDEALAGSAPALLIAHHAISEAKGQPRGLHRAPSSIGEMAAGVGARRLVLSHNMKRALNARKGSLKAIRTKYDGPVTIADDHACFTIIR